MKTHSTYNILLIDDELHVAQVVRDLFIDNPLISIESVHSGADAIAAIEKAPRKYAVVLVDYMMPDMNGAAVVKKLTKINHELIIAMHSGDKSRDSLKKSILAGAVDFIEKGIPQDELKMTILSLCKKFEESVACTQQINTRARNEELINSVGMIGQSTKMAQVASLMLRAAQTDSNVLIYGESGTGKELVAKGIHKLSSRSNYNFIPINMGAVHGDTFESQMFGHMKGSFTGALHDSQGFVRAANCGTLFMDEIGDMPSDQQVKILRLIQENEVLSVGGLKPQKVNVRFVFATNVNLETAIKQKQFREDLYYRINVVVIQLPPLRDRLEDIPALIHFFKTKLKGKHKVFTKEVISKFQKYKWPGNIRELENEMEKLITVVPDETITLKHLDNKFYSNQELKENDLSKFSYPEFTQFAEQQEITYVMEIMKHYKSLREAAKEGFQISESTLRSRLEKLHLKL